MVLERKWSLLVQVTERWGAGVETLLGSRLKMAVLKVNIQHQDIVCEI